MIRYKYLNQEASGNDKINNIINNESVGSIEEKICIERDIEMRKRTVALPKRRAVDNDIVEVEGRNSMRA